MANGLETHLLAWGEPALFVSVFLEAAGLPTPGETAIISGFLLAAAGKFSLAKVALYAFAAAVLGDNVGYAAGRFLGRDLLLKHGGPIGVSEARLQRVEAALEHRGALLVVAARFFPFLRQLAGVTAGISEMRWPLFLVANMTGAALWVGMWGTLVHVFGVNFESRIVGWLKLPGGALPYTLAAAVLALAIVWLVHRLRRRPD